MLFKTVHYNACVSLQPVGVVVDDAADVAAFKSFVPKAAAAAAPAATPAAVSAAATPAATPAPATTTAAAPAVCQYRGYDNS